MSNKPIQVPANLRPFGGHKNYSKNLSDSKYGDATCCCVLCGKDAVGDLTVALTNVSEYTRQEDLDTRDCLGHYPVGSDCAKKLKAAGVPVYSGVYADVKG